LSFNLYDHRAYLRDAAIPEGVEVPVLAKELQTKKERYSSENRMDKNAHLNVNAVSTGD